MSERAVRGPYDPEARVVAVTGACGFVGSQLLQRLEAERRYTKLLAVDIRRPSFPLRKTQFHKIDLTLPTADADLAAVLLREGVDTVVHTAFLSTPTHNTAWAHELESIGTMHVLNAATEARVHKLVMLSTTLVYGASPKNPNFLTEAHEPKGHPRSRFVNDKYEAEKQARRFEHENPDSVVTVLRAAATLGPHIDNFATKFFARPVCPVLMGYDPLIQFVHEDDLVDAFVLAVDEDHRGVFNIVSEGVLPYTTVLAILGRVPLPLPTFLAYRVSQALWMTQVFDSPPNFLDYIRFLCIADGTKARRELGFRPRRDIRATLRDFLGAVPTGAQLSLIPPPQAELAARPSAPSLEGAGAAQEEG
jgi:UDP-glucose 4-epimerase